MPHHLNSPALANLLRDHLTDHLRALGPEVHSIQPSIKDNVSVVAFVAGCPSLHKFMMNSGVSGRGRIGKVTWICLQGLCQLPFRRQEYAHQLEPMARQRLLDAMNTLQSADESASNSQDVDNGAGVLIPQASGVASSGDRRSRAARDVPTSCSVTLFVWETARDPPRRLSATGEHRKGEWLLKVAAVPALPTHEGDWLNLDIASGDWLSRPSIKSLRSVYPGCVLMYLAPGVSPQADLNGVREVLREANIALRYRRAANYLAMGYSVTEGISAAAPLFHSTDGQHLSLQRRSNEASLPPSSPLASSAVESRASSSMSAHASSDQDLDWLFASDEAPNTEPAQARVHVARDSAHRSGGVAANESLPNLPQARRYHPFAVRPRRQHLHTHKKHVITKVDIDLTLDDSAAGPSASNYDGDVIILE